MKYNELTHYGIEGQKWGVRRGPPYPIEDTTMKKGTRLNTVSIRSRKNVYPENRWLFTYNPDDKWDSKVYKGPFSVYLIQRYYGEKIYEHEYETIKDLKMPTKKERMDEFVEVFNSNKLFSAMELRDIQTRMKQYSVGSEESKNVNLFNLKTDDDYKAAYEIFQHAMEASNQYRITKKYSKAMQKKYDAMVDDNNQGVYNCAHDPVIIFNVNKALKEIGDAQVVDIKEIGTNFNDVKLELAKKGESIKL